MCKNKFKIPFFVLAFLFCFEFGIFTGFDIYKIQSKIREQTYKEKTIQAKEKRLILICC